MAMFTPNEERILKVLADGKAHPRAELLECLLDPLATKSCLVAAIFRIRKKLKPFNQYIVCEVTGPGPWCYRHIQLLNTALPASQPVSFVSK